MVASRRQFLGLSAMGVLGISGLTPQPTRSGAPLRFDMHSAFWINLHHRLYLQAQVFQATGRGRALDATSDSWSVQAAMAWTEYLTLTAAQREVWQRSLKSYVDRGLADQDLLESFMPSIDAALASIEDASEPVASDALHAGTVEALLNAAPAYRQTLWPIDDAANRKWIGAVTPMILAHSARLTSQLRRWYQTPWPVGPYRLDVVRYANWAGCYTNTDPIHIIMSSRDFFNDSAHRIVPNSGFTSLEMVFHEASHTVVTPGYGSIGSAIENAATRLKKSEPEGFWHAVIFYTAGRAIAEEIPGYEMFADKASLYTGNWATYRRSLVGHWEPYLAGRTSLAPALQSAVASVLNNGPIKA